jgi:hypothetical protein
MRSLLVPTGILVVIAIAVILFVQLYHPAPAPAANGTPGAAMSAGPQGRPCSSNEEWHKKAEETGAWIDGVLVATDVPDDEILEILHAHGVPDAAGVRITTPHYIGYYLAVPEGQYAGLRASIEGNETALNLAFSSPMYGFTAPEDRSRNGTVLAPVFVTYTSHIREIRVFRDLQSRGIPVRRAKVVAFDLQSLLPPSDRERLLVNLSGDSRVIASYKEYLEGVMC